MTMSYRPLYRAVYESAIAHCGMLNRLIAHYIGLSTYLNPSTEKFEPCTYRPLYRAVYITTSLGSSDIIVLSPIISGCLQQYLVFLFTNSTIL